jgi:hypothetical protein
MSTISPVKVFTKTMASGASVLTFNVGGGYKAYMVRLPSMASGGDVRFNVSHDEGTTFKTLYHSPTVATALPTVVNIASSVSNAVVGVPPLGEHFQIAVTTAATATAYDFSVICIA